MPNGTITWYATKNDFEAVCNHEGHRAGRRCVMTRTAVGRETALGVRGGRPLGLMAAWLARASGPQVSTRAAHWNAAMLASLTSAEGFSERLIARLDLMSTPGGRDLADLCERDQDDDDPPGGEPLVAPDN